MVVIDDFPLPADAFLKADEFVGAGASGFFVDGIATGLTVTQWVATLGIAVVGFAVRAILIPLRLAALGDSSES